MPLLAICEEWFILVLLVRSGEEQDLNDDKIDATKKKLQKAFIIKFAIVIGLWLFRLSIDIWTNHLGLASQKTNFNYYC
jgi:hypothetical protein